jgi:hypothetical protein
MNNSSSLTNTKAFQIWIAFLIFIIILSFILYYKKYSISNIIIIDIALFIAYTLIVNISVYYYVTHYLVPNKK